MTFWRRLEAFGDAPALIAEDGAQLSHAELAARADRLAIEMRARLPASVERPLVLIETANEAEPIIAYLAALRAGWPVILAADGASEGDSRIRDTYRPNLIFRRRHAGGWEAELHSKDAAGMHADLAVMLSTSGTTGAPKLVRLSARNLQANAESIAGYLGISASERAITTLPFHYSYGLSVLHTHLLRGAALVLTERSVVEEEFWRAFEQSRATSLALVPFQFELLESKSFETRLLPSLRTITQAGGKLAEPAIRRFAALGRRDGWRLFVMYGQTEAAPRMAYVPPDLLEENADAIGQTVPGGRFELIGTDGQPILQSGVAGELVYHGENVMMGYATRRADLALGQGPSVLHTGDVALRKENGLYRIVGRMSRFVKPYGLRIGLDEIEERLRREGLAAYATGSDRRIVVFLAGEADRAAVRARLTGAYGLSEAALLVEPIGTVPLLSSGKVDYRALAERAASLGPERAVADGSLDGLVAAALRRDTVDPERSFAELGGDSLAYLEVQLALAERLGVAPDGWETMPLRELDALRPKPRPWLQLVPVDLAVRVLALTAVIALHATTLPIAGGAHVLLMLVGYSLARFQKARLLAGEIGPMLATMALPILACYLAILAALHALSQPVDAEWFLLLGNFDKDIHPAGITPYWFVCLYVQVLVLVALPFTAPVLRRWIGANPLAAGVGLAVLAAAAALVLGLPEELGATSLRHPLMALQLIAVGWTALHARTTAGKLVATGLAGTVGLGFWPVGPVAVGLLVAASCAVIWGRSLPLPGLVAWAMLQLGRSSMLVYLTHVIVISLLARLAIGNDALKLVATMILSLLAAEAASRALRLVLQARHGLAARWQRA